MKKTLLTIGAIVGVAAGAFAQGQLDFDIPSSTGINSVTSNPNDPDAGGTDFFLNDATGIATFSVFYASNSASLLTEAAAINTDDRSASTLQAGLTLLNADFTQEAFGTTLGTEALTQNIEVDYGDLDVPEQGNYDIGTAANITSGTSGLYAIEVTYNNYVGFQVLNGAGIGTPAVYNVGGGQSSAASMVNEWANQSLFINPVPEPTTLAMAGLGGLSMLFMRRRKS
jgi:hypothetical protein